MSIILGESPAELVSGENENIAVDLNGVARLTSKNLLPDPGLYQSTARGAAHPYWDLDSSPRPDGWGVYMRDFEELKIISRQNNGLNLDLSDTSFQQEDALVNGPSFSKLSEGAERIARPDEPRVRTISLPIAGYPEGWYVASYAYTNDRRVGNTDNITEIAPKSDPFFLAQGQVFRMEIAEEEIPREVTGIIIYLSEPTDNQNIVLNQPMYEQRRISKRYIRNVFRLNGPYHHGGRAKEDTNSTQIGVRGDIRFRYGRRRSPYSRRSMIFRLGGRFITQTGESASLPVSNIVRTNFRRHEALAYHPRGWPSKAVAWIPEILNLDGSNDSDAVWYTIEKTYGDLLRRGQFAHWWTLDPEQWPHKRTKLVTTERVRAREDSSGITAPDSNFNAIEIVDPANSQGLTPGLHVVRHTLWNGDEEGPVSKPARIQVGVGEAIRTFRPLFHNRMDNNELQEVDASGEARGWILNRPPGTGTGRAPGKLIHRDQTGNTTNQNAYSTPAAYLTPGEDKFIIRFRVSLDLYVSGKIAYWLDEFDGNDVLLQSTVMTSVWKAQDALVTRRLRRTGGDSNPGSIRLHNDVSYVRVRGKTQGATNAGPLDLRVTFKHLGVFESWATPRKRNRVEFGRSDGIEQSTFVYPHGGYCTIVENPPERAQFISDRGIYSTDRFENGIDGTVVDSDPTVGGGVATIGAAAQHGDFGLSVSSSGAKSTAVDRYVEYPMGGVNSNARGAISSFLNLFRVHDAGACTLFGLVSDTGKEIARIRINSNPTNGSRMYLQGPLIGGSRSNINLNDGIDQDENTAIEVFAHRLGTADGIIICYMGRGLQTMQEVGRIENIDFTGETSVDFGRVGMYDESDATSTGEYHFDHLAVSDLAIFHAEDIPGNMFEYYGPAGTPKKGSYGPTGMQVPVKPGATYTLQARVNGEDVAPDSQLFRTVFRNKNGQIVKRNLPLTNLSGDTDGWVLRTITFTAPKNAHYLDFYANLLGAGTVQVMGIQLETRKNILSFNQSSAEEGTTTGLRAIQSILTNSTEQAIQGTRSFKMEAPNGTQRGISFDGVNDRIGFPNTYTLSRGFSPQSVEVNAILGSDVTTKQILAEVGGTGNGWDMYIQNGNLVFDSYVSAVLASMTYPVTANEAVQFSVVGDGTTITLYKNGVEVASILSDLVNGGGAEGIAADENGEFLFTGFISFVRTWEKALTVEEINQHLYSQLDGTQTGLYALYNLEDLVAGKNLLTYNQSSAEEGTTTGMRSFGSATPTLSTTTSAIEGVYSFRMEATADGSMTVDTFPVQVPVTEGETLSAQCSLLSSSGGFPRINLIIRDASGNIIFAPVYDETSFTGSVQTLSLTATAPPNAVSADVRVIGYSTLTGDIVDIDKLQIEVASSSTSWVPGGTLVATDESGNARDGIVYGSPIVENRTAPADLNYYRLDTYSEQKFVPAGTDVSGSFEFISPPGREQYMAVMLRSVDNSTSVGAAATTVVTDGTTQYISVTQPAVAQDANVFISVDTEGGKTGDVTYVDKLQLEYGSSATTWENGRDFTRYSEEIAANGFLEFVLDLGIPGMGRLDPMEYLDSIATIEDIAMVADEDDGSIATLSFASKSTPDETPTFTTNEGDLNPRMKYVHCRIDMQSNLDQTVSPEATGVGVYVGRNEPILCRPDGTDFYGGVLVRNVPGVSPEHNIETDTNTAGVPRFKTWSPTPNEWIRGLEIEVYRDETMREMRGLVGEEESIFILEAHGKRYELLILDMSFDVVPSSRHTTLEGEPFVIHKATGVDGFVISEETIE